MKRQLTAREIGIELFLRHTHDSNGIIVYTQPNLIELLNKLGHTVDMVQLKTSEIIAYKNKDKTLNQ